ncbi:hypothetical protein [Achromobacter spanius]|uniref:hypothetical protein n=1 Tax=Achromobacter spanius TaxID=217203 RepID=UPI00380AB010
MTASEECLVIGLKEEPRTFARLFSFMHREFRGFTRQKCQALGSGILTGESGDEPHCKPFFTAHCIEWVRDDGDAYLIRLCASTRYVWIL